MPGFDGSGPFGLGPMSGGGKGFCALRLPAGPGEAVTGYAGMAGFPVAIPVRGLSAELAALRDRTRLLEMALSDFKQRIRLLQGGNTIVQGL